MAVVWANQAGNWTNTAIWSYWDEATQSIQLYGQVPQENDIVYTNGYQVTISSNSQIKVAKLTNEINPYTNLGGSFFIVQTNCLITADVYCETGILLYFSNIGGVFTIVGNVETSHNDANSQVIYLNTYNSLIQINIIGNIYVNNGRLGNGVSSFQLCTNMTITGNIYCNGIAFTNQAPRITTINGNVSINNGSFFNYSVNNTNNYVNGNITYNSPISYIEARAAKKLTINGNLYYSVKNPFLNVAEVVFENDNWEWRYIGAGDPDFIILPYPSQPNVFPNETDVKKDVVYAGGLLVGTFEPNYPPESVVLDGFEYGEGMTGTMTQSVQVGCVTKEDVREGVALLGMGENGTLVVPSADDVREGVVFDNGTIGTLIVQGGGDRLRIADFGYYTNAQSDTYIVDITEADKPKFASAEERILIEMFPSLDLNNIPEMYFDDLFVKYLKYRLIVEYYRTAGVNSTFTPSEPTTEIVNYRNVTCEVWLNSANIYLNAWNKKFGLNKPPQKVRL